MTDEISEKYTETEMYKAQQIASLLIKPNFEITGLKLGMDWVGNIILTNGDGISRLFQPHFHQILFGYKKRITEKDFNRIANLVVEFLDKHGFTNNKFYKKIIMHNCKILSKSYVNNPIASNFWNRIAEDAIMDSTADYSYFNTIKTFKEKTLDYFSGFVNDDNT